MSRRVVIADAGPLIALARIERLDLLRILFSRVVVTTAVRDEILPSRESFPDAPLLTRTLDEGWIDIVEVEPDGWLPQNPGIDCGEESALRLARQWRDSGTEALLVMDDRAARLEARAISIPVIGTAAVIGAARTRGIIAAARPLLEQLARCGYFIGPAVVRAVLDEVGE